MTISEKMETMLIPTAMRIDWFSVLACLADHGVNNTQAAAQSGVTRDVIRSAKKGCEPLYLHGALILRLHARHCGCDHAKGDTSPPN